MSWLSRLDPVAFAVARARRRMRARAGLARLEAQLPDGRRVVYLDSLRDAPPEAPTAVLLHGIGASKDNWTALGERLRGQLRLVVPDLPGFGESTRTGDFSMAAQAEATVALAGALGIERFHLAGSSMGGRVAAELATAHANRVRTLWLLAPAAAEGERPSEMIEGLFAGEGVPLFSRTADEVAATHAFAMSRPPAVPRVALRVLAREGAEAYDLNRRIFADMSVAFSREPTTESLLRGLPVPTLVSWGAEDRVLHASGAATIGAAMPHATVRVMPGIGHLPMLEAPDDTARDYLAFLEAHPDA